MGGGRAPETSATGTAAAPAALVVGGYSSIGSAVGSELESVGWRVLRSSSSRPADIKLDLRDPTSFGALAASLPSLRAVVVCAGRAPERSLEETTVEHVQEMLAVHLAGPLLLLQALRGNLADGAAVVLIASIAAFRGSYDPAYATAKGGVVSLARTLARAWAPSVRVNALAPGLVRHTPVWEHMTPDFRKRHVESTLSGELVDTKECARAAVFLIENRGMTGSVLHLNGGAYLA
jgi:3-oxoacyl-[acyl-carrier protein] reductase